MRIPFLKNHALGTGIYGFPETSGESVKFSPGPLSIEHTGIFNAAGHEDIEVAHGTPFYLPVGLWYVSQFYLGDGWGWTVAFRPPDSQDEIVFEHMYTVNSRLVVGQKYRGGTRIGLSGGVVGTDPGLIFGYSSGPHLHVAYAYGVKKYLKNIYGKRMFVGSVPIWQYGQPLHDGGRTFRRNSTHYE